MEDVAAALVPIAWGSGQLFPLTGSYCPARAADARRHNSTSPGSRSEQGLQPPCRRTRSVDGKTPELETYV